MTELPLSRNFRFLEVHDRQLVRLGTLAEQYFADDPNTCLIKVRQYGELLAQLVAARTGAYTTPDEPQSDLLRRLKGDGIVPHQALDFFHQIRVNGNRATHGHHGSHSGALTALKLARQLGIWFHRAFGDDKEFRPGPFAPPSNPAVVTVELREELERLREALAESQNVAERAHLKAEEEARKRESAEERALRESNERSIWENSPRTPKTRRRP